LYEEQYDYRADLAEIDEYCSYLDEILEDEITTSWTVLKRTQDYIIFINCVGNTRTISAQYINSVFKEN